MAIARQCSDESMDDMVWQVHTTQPMEGDLHDTIWQVLPMWDWEGIMLETQWAGIRVPPSVDIR